jgi:hypothetical protein
MKRSQAGQPGCRQLPGTAVVAAPDLRVDGPAR